MKGINIKFKNFLELITVNERFLGYTLTEKNYYMLLESGGGFIFCTRVPYETIIQQHLEKNELERDEGNIKQALTVFKSRVFENRPNTVRFYLLPEQKRIIDSEVFVESEEVIDIINPEPVIQIEGDVEVMNDEEEEDIQNAKREES